MTYKAASGERGVEKGRRGRVCSLLSKLVLLEERGLEPVDSYCGSHLSGVSS